MVVPGSHRKNQIELAKYLKSIKLENGQPKFDITALTFKDVTDKVEEEFAHFEDRIRIVTLDHEEGTLAEDIKTKISTEELLPLIN